MTRSGWLEAGLLAVVVALALLAVSSIIGHLERPS